MTKFLICLLFILIPLTSVSRDRDDSYIDEQYKIKGICLGLGKHFTHIMANLGAWRAGNEDRVSVKLENKECYIKINNHKDSTKRNSITLSDFHYSPESDMNYGAIRVIINEAKDSGKSKSFDATNYNKDSEFDWEHKVTRTQKETHEFNQEYRAEITSETTISGEYGGASVEQKVSATFGTTLQVNTSGEDERSIEETINIPIQVNAGEIVIAHIKNTRLVTEQPFTINGVLDFKISFNFENWSQGGKNGKLVWGSRKAHNYISFNAINDFLRFLNGYDIKYPRMSQFASICKGKCGKAWDWLLDDKNRRIEVSGIKRVENSDNEDYSLEDVQVKETVLTPASK